MSKSGTAPVGKVIGPHGVRGEVRVSVYIDLEDFPWKNISLSGKGLKRTLTVERVRPHKGVLIIKFSELTSRDEAETLSGCELVVPASEFPEPEADEYYYFDLVGMDVVEEGSKASTGELRETGESRKLEEGISPEPGYLGKVTNVIFTGSNDVFEVHGPRGEILIPAIKEVVLDIDHESRRITVRLLEGLVENAPSEGPKKKHRRRGGKAGGEGTTGG